MPPHGLCHPTGFVTPMGSVTPLGSVTPQVAQGGPVALLLSWAGGRRCPRCQPGDRALRGSWFLGTRRELLWGSFLATPLLHVGWGGDSPQAQPRGSLQASACCHCMRPPLES